MWEFGPEEFQRHQEYGFLCKTSRLFIFLFQATDIYMLFLKRMPDGGGESQMTVQKEWHWHHFSQLFHYYKQTTNKVKLFPKAFSWKRSR